MTPALILIDFQNDFLAAPELQPAAGAIVERAAVLLHRCRENRIPIVHVVTTVHRDRDDRMPHWKASGKWNCETGTSGHAPPTCLDPVAGEPIVDKQYFSGFANARLDGALREHGCDTVILAGVHLHGCVRATALDAYERGYAVWIVEDAIGSDDPLHAATTRRWLADRFVRFESAERIARILANDRNAIDSRESIRHYSPGDPRELLWTAPIKGAREVAAATGIAREAHKVLRDLSVLQRTALAEDLASRLSDRSEELAQLITRDVGKPITMSRGEVRRSIAIVHAVAQHAASPSEVPSVPGTKYRHAPLGVVGAVTPWNNPLAIPIGRIVPAVVYGNAVVWKPAPAATMVARRLCEIFRDCQWKDFVQLCEGDHSTACTLASDPDIDGVTLSGSLRAGYALQELCARGHIPFQAELGGNNAAIVWDDADLCFAAGQVASAAFGFAGQRCTANRRVIVSDRIYHDFLGEVGPATRALPWGDPLDESVVVGPLINTYKAIEVMRLLERASTAKMEILTPHRSQRNFDYLLKHGYIPPSIVLAGDEHRTAEIVQEETFGPVLVVQRASSFPAAIQKLNAVRQGLVAALFSNSPDLRQTFLNDARAGVLKFNSGTADADASSPLGGWKASGVGPAEHGPCDREFFCRVQTIYDAQGPDRR